MSLAAFGQDRFADPPPVQGGFSLEEEREAKSDLASGLHDWAVENAGPLQLDAGRPVSVEGFHSVFRVAPNGRLLSELVVQFAQQDQSLTDSLGGVPFRGGTTVIAGADGRVRYVIAKPLSRVGEGVAEQANRRLERQRGYPLARDRSDRMMTYGDAVYLKQRSLVRMRLSTLHEGFGQQVIDAPKGMTR